MRTSVHVLVSLFFVSFCVSFFLSFYACFVCLFVSATNINPNSVIDRWIRSSWPPALKGFASRHLLNSCLQACSAEGAAGAKWMFGASSGRPVARTFHAWQPETSRRRVETLLICFVVVVGGGGCDNAFTFPQFSISLFLTSALFCAPLPTVPVRCVHAGQSLSRLLEGVFDSTSRPLMKSHVLLL